MNHFTCFNLGSEFPCMAVIGWARVFDCRQVYCRVDEYRQRVKHHPPGGRVFSLLFTKCCSPLECPDGVIKVRAHNCERMEVFFKL